MAQHEEIGMVYGVYVVDVGEGNYRGYPPDTAGSILNVLAHVPAGARLMEVRFLGGEIGYRLLFSGAAAEKPPRGRWVAVKERKPDRCDRSVWVAIRHDMINGYSISRYAYNPDLWPSTVTHWWDGPDPWVGTPD